MDPKQNSLVQSLKWLISSQTLQIFLYPFVQTQYMLLYTNQSTGSGNFGIRSWLQSNSLQGNVRYNTFLLQLYFSLPCNLATFKQFDTKVPAKQLLRCWCDNSPTSITFCDVNSLITITSCMRISRKRNIELLQKNLL